MMKAVLMNASKLCGKLTIIQTTIENKHNWVRLHRSQTHNVMAYIIYNILRVDDINWSEWILALLIKLEEIKMQQKQLHLMKGIGFRLGNNSFRLMKSIHNKLIHNCNVFLYVLSQNISSNITCVEQNKSCGHIVPFDQSITMIKERRRDLQYRWIILWIYVEELACWIVVVILPCLIVVVTYIVTPNSSYHMHRQSACKIIHDIYQIQNYALAKI